MVLSRRRKFVFGAVLFAAGLLVAGWWAVRPDYRLVGVWKAELGETFIFRADGTAVMIAGDIADTCGWRTAGNKLVLDPEFGHFLSPERLQFEAHMLWARLTGSPSISLDEVFAIEWISADTIRLTFIPDPTLDDFADSDDTSVENMSDIFHRATRAEDSR